MAMTPQLILMILAVVFGLYMAWNIGANDLANAMGTSVGSGALTLRRAIILAAILEFCGAVFVGSSVTQTMRKGIVDPAIFTNEPLLFACGMLASLLAAACWLQVASYFGWPVSTTHSIVGAILGFGLVHDPSQVNWMVVAKIGSSWVISPLLSAAMAFLIFQAIRKGVLYARNPLQATRRVLPWLVAVIFFTITLSVLLDATKNKRLNFAAVDLGAGLVLSETMQTLLLSLLAGVVSAAVSWAMIARSKSIAIQPAVNHDYFVAMSLNKALKQIRRVQMGAAPGQHAELASVVHQIENLKQKVDHPEDQGVRNADHVRVERIFGYLQIVSAGYVAFAHGANDVANAIGPVAAVVHAVNFGKVEGNTAVPFWILLMGGLGIVVGLATWGWRVIETIGKRITELTPSRGFTAEFSTALTVLVASKMGLPISTTHTLVGAVLGVGLARGISALNLHAIRDIVASWLITIPAGASLSVVFYFAIKAIVLS